jgi:hypothetical protein
MMARPSSSGETAKLSACGLGIRDFFGIGRDEAIAPADYGLQILGFVGVVGQGAADFADGGIDSLLDVDEHVFAPQLQLEISSRVTSCPRFSTRNISNCRGSPRGEPGGRRGRAESGRNRARNRRSGLSYRAPANSWPCRRRAEVPMARLCLAAKKSLRDPLRRENCVRNSVLLAALSSAATVNFFRSIQTASDVPPWTFPGDRAQYHTHLRDLLTAPGH